MQKIFLAVIISILTILAVAPALASTYLANTKSTRCEGTSKN